MSLYCAGSSYEDGIIEEDLFYEEKGYQYLTANFTPDGYDCVREKFLGVYGTEDHSAGLERGTLEGSTELGGNHRGSLQKNFKLQPGEEARFVIMLGEGNREEGRRIRVKYSDLKRVDAVYTDLAAYWKQKYAALQIQTPNEGMNTLYIIGCCELFVAGECPETVEKHGFRVFVISGNSSEFFHI